MIVIVIANANRQICLSDECLRSAAGLKQIMNRNVDPCDDFYEYVCGNWAEDRTERDDGNGWMQERQLKIYRNIRAHLERDAKRFDPKPVAQAKVMYRSCLGSVIPVALVQYPFYYRGLEALNYGAIGTVLGHELTHGFDSNGRFFDKFGNMRTWWSAQTHREYETRANCLVEQYNSYSLPEGFVNGTRTLGENIADNGGVREALRAYQAFVKRHGPEPTLPGFDDFSHEQLFFISFANLWCSTLTPARAKALLSGDAHSPGKFRVRGTVSNMPEFSEAFRCAPGTAMNPARKCRVWCRYALIPLVLFLTILVIYVIFDYPPEPPPFCATAACIRTGWNLKQSMNLQVKPCDDFYSYVCGGNWTKPSDKRKPGNEWQNLLAENVSQSEPKPVHQAKQMFNACTDRGNRIVEGYSKLEGYYKRFGLPTIPTVLKRSEGWAVEEDLPFDWVNSAAQIRRSLGLNVFIGIDAADTNQLVLGYPDLPKGWDYPQDSDQIELYIWGVVSTFLLRHRFSHVGLESDCADQVHQLMGPAISYMVIAANNPDNASVEVMLQRVRPELKQTILAIDWMDAPSRNGSLTMINAKIEVLERVLNASKLELYYRELDVGGNNLENWINGLGFVSVNKLKSWRSTSGSQWDPSATILQKPFRDLGLDSLNLGSLGVTLISELLSGLANSSSWSNRTNQAYAHLATCSEDNRFELDAVGLILAMQVFKQTEETEQPLPGEFFTAQQAFFISYGWQTCNGDRGERSKSRVNNVVRNFEPFSEAFECSAGSPMNPEEKCGVWN
ncbi:zinc metalloprotease [Culex quinquefasciatus]|uniref:Zinc metalloprotease n=1 Tax=Culex quinquefasciatus TaxID=7176 RepID=B0X6H2_CULQU|nr:zinc metalloprotease [Culex quinquefasciatus]|eukprot:XP_001865244.1 zinc metalloprotease [Culex quinquefasciatus]